MTLAIVTAYYAIQTHRIVKESEKKRIADFQERRISEFYKPFIDKLDDMENLINLGTIKNMKTKNIAKSTDNLLREKKYMISRKTLIDIFKLRDDLINNIISETKDNEKAMKLFFEFNKAREKVRQIVTKEKLKIEEKIREFYDIKD